MEAGKEAFEAYLGRPFPLEQPGTDGWVGTRALAVRAATSASATRTPTLDALLAAAQAGMPAWRDAGPGRPRGGLPGDPRPDQRPHFEIAHAVHAHQRAGVRDGVPGRRPARAGPGLEAVAYAYAEMTRHAGHGALGEAAGQARPAAHDQDVHGRAARRRAGDRLQHVPDLERLPGAVRQPGHRQPGHRQAAPARGAAAGHHASRSPARCWPRPASTRTW